MKEWKASILVAGVVGMVVSWGVYLTIGQLKIWKDNRMAKELKDKTAEAKRKIEKAKFNAFIKDIDERHLALKLKPILLPPSAVRANSRGIDIDTRNRHYIRVDSRGYVIASTQSVVICKCKCRKESNVLR